MDKFKAGTLNSSSGQKVTNPKQAVAIEMSEKSAAEHGKSEYLPSDHPIHKLKSKRRA